MTELPKEMWREILGFELLPRNRRISSIHNDIEQELIDEKVQKLRNTFPNATSILNFVYEELDTSNNTIDFVAKNFERFSDMFDDTGIEDLAEWIGSKGWREDIDKYLLFYQDKPRVITLNSIAYGAINNDRLSIIRMLHSKYNLSLEFVVRQAILSSRLDYLEWALNIKEIPDTYIPSLIFFSSLHCNNNYDNEVFHYLMSRHNIDYDSMIDPIYDKSINNKQALYDYNPDLAKRSSIFMSSFFKAASYEKMDVAINIMYTMIVEGHHTSLQECLIDLVNDTNLPLDSLILLSSKCVEFGIDMESILEMSNRHLVL